MCLKGIIMAGGGGSRLHPMTRYISKHLLPVYDKPMIFYPLYTLISLGIRNIMLITHPKDLDNYCLLLGDGSDFGIALSYALQPEPKGIAQAFHIGENFLNGSPAAFILGDNIFLGDLHAKVKAPLNRIAEGAKGAVIFGYEAAHPENFGVAELTGEVGKPLVKGLEEKPSVPKSNWAVTGMYLYDGEVSPIAREIHPSAKGELEITDLNRLYLEKGRLGITLLDSDIFWQDAGTPEGLFKAGEAVRERISRNKNPGVIEEAAFNQGWMTESMVEARANWYDGRVSLGNNEYARYLRALVKDGGTHFG